MIKPRKHSEYWQEGTDNRNCPKCGRFMKFIREKEEGDDEEFMALQCRPCDILVIIR